MLYYAIIVLMVWAMASALVFAWLMCKISSLNMTLQEIKKNTNDLHFETEHCNRMFDACERMYGISESTMNYMSEYYDTATDVLDEVGEKLDSLCQYKDELTSLERIEQSMARHHNDISERMEMCINQLNQIQRPQQNAERCN